MEEGGKRRVLQTPTSKIQIPMKTPAVKAEDWIVEKGRREGPVEK
jgi:hypothetical protein